MLLTFPTLLWANNALAANAAIGATPAGPVTSWNRNIPGQGYGWSVAAIADGSAVYAAGATRGSFAGQANPGGYSAFLIRYDSRGDVVWERLFGSSGEDDAYDVSVDTTGVYVAGNTTGSFDGQTNPGGSSAFLVKYIRLVRWTDKPRNHQLVPGAIQRERQPALDAHFWRRLG
jgi:hypothetical protein